MDSWTSCGAKNSEAWDANAWRTLCIRSRRNPAASRAATYRRRRAEPSRKSPVREQKTRSSALVKRRRCVSRSFSASATCHAGGRGFKSRRSRSKKAPQVGAFCVVARDVINGPSRTGYRCGVPLDAAPATRCSSQPTSGGASIATLGATTHRFDVFPIACQPPTLRTPLRGSSAHAPTRADRSTGPSDPYTRNQLP